MIKFDVRPDFRAMRRTLTDLQRKKLPQATARALNKTVMEVRTEARREIRKTRKLPVRVINASLKVRKAHKSRLVATITASGEPIPLRDYGATQRRKGVTVNVSGRRKIVKDAFIVDKIGRHVFKRVGHARLPIKKLYGPSLPTAFVTRAVTAAMTKKAAKAWPKNMSHQLRRITSK